MSNKPPVFGDNKIQHKHVSQKKIIQFDNNSTTPLCEPAKRALIHWSNCANPSSDSSIAMMLRAEHNRCIKFIQELCNASDYTVIFTSGATESNCTIMEMTIAAYWKILQVKPHVVVSAVEHHAMLEQVDKLVSEGRVEVTKMRVNRYGLVDPDHVGAAIRKNTCLVSIICANNEIGSVNNIPRIGQICETKRVPLHTDAVQYFGKYMIDVKKYRIAALSASAHKFYGPKGVGILLLSNRLIRGYKIQAMIPGSQQSGLRGGTLNLPGIISCCYALHWAHQGRAKKNKHLHALCARMISGLKSILTERPITDFIDRAQKPGARVISHPYEFVILGPPLNKTRLPNTLLIAVINHIGQPFCNVKFKRALDEHNVVIGISSACMTDSPYASHVIRAIDAPDIIKKGVLRISFSDYNTTRQIDEFLRIFNKILKMNF